MTIKILLDTSHIILFEPRLESDVILCGFFRVGTFVDKLDHFLRLVDPAGTLLKPWNRVREAGGVRINFIGMKVYSMYVSTCLQQFGRSVSKKDLQLLATDVILLIEASDK